MSAIWTDTDIRLAVEDTAQSLIIYGNGVLLSGARENTTLITRQRNVSL